MNKVYPTPRFTLVTGGTMIGWRNVRSKEALTLFIIEFEGSTLAKRKKILTEMLECIEVQRQLDLDLGLFVLTPRQVEEQISNYKRRKRSRR